MQVKYGLCCLHLGLEEQGFKMQKMTVTRFKELPRENALKILSGRILNNFIVTKKIIQQCYDEGLRSYRVSSTLIPVINHPDINLELSGIPDSDIIGRYIRECGDLAKKLGVRLSAHPSEFISLTSMDENVITNSIRDLKQHGDLFDWMGLPQDYSCPLNIHIRQDGNPVEIAKTFLKNFDRLPDNVKKRLVLENNDTGEAWNIENLYEYAYKSAAIPLTFDDLHFNFVPTKLSKQEAYELAYSTWITAEPIFHYSEGIGKTRKHADYYTAPYENFGKEVYVDCEVKMKDLAIQKMLSSYHK